MPWVVFIPVVLGALVVMGVEIAITMRAHPCTQRGARAAIAGIVSFPVAIVLHNVLSTAVGGEEGASFILALVVAPAMTVFGTIAFIAALARDRTAGNLALSFALAAAGMALFAVYMLFALAVTAIAGGNPPYQAAIEAVLIPVSGSVIVAGVILAGIQLIGRVGRAAGGAPR